MGDVQDGLVAVRRSFGTLADFADFLQARPESCDRFVIDRLGAEIRRRGKVLSPRFGWVDAEVRGTNYREDIQILGAPCRGMAVLDLLDETLNSNPAANILCCEDENGVSRLIARAYPGALSCTNERGANIGGKGLRLTINPAVLGFADGTFDAIVFSETLGPRPDLADALAECRRVLRPGGVLLATFPFACLAASGWETSRVLDWSVVAICEAAGFARACMIYRSDAEAGILGGDLDGVFVLHCAA